MTPRERSDMTYIIGIVVLVLVIFIAVYLTP